MGEVAGLTLGTKKFLQVHVLQRQENEENEEATKSASGNRIG